MIEEEREETVDARARTAAHTTADVAAEKLAAAASLAELSPSASPEAITTTEPQQIHTLHAAEGTGLSVQEMQAIGDLAMGSSVSMLSRLCF